MIKIPDTVFVGSQIYKIYLQNGVIDHSDNVVCNGLTIDRTKSIFLDYNLEETNLRITLLHELIHAIHEEYNIEENADEERTASVMSVALFNLFVDNPDLTACLYDQIQRTTKLKAKKFNG